MHHEGLAAEAESTSKIWSSRCKTKFAKARRIDGQQAMISEAKIHVWVLK